MGDDHVLDFLDVVGLRPFLWLPLSSKSVPLKDAVDTFNGHVTLARRQEIVLDGLQALPYGVPLFECSHYAC